MIHTMCKRFFPGLYLVIISVSMIYLVFTPLDSLADQAQLVIYSPSGNRSCTFRVELALSPSEQARGLMFREKLDDFAGMLFVFEKDDFRHFWMRNTLIPLDLIFIDTRYHVVDIHRGAKPLDETVISSKKPCRYVLEVNAGMGERCGVRPGTRVKLVTSH